MRAFMAVILSACLMLSSVTPSLAGGLPVNPLKGVTRVVRVKPVELAGANKNLTALIKPSSKLFRVYTPDVRLPGVSTTLPGIKITGASPTVPQIYSATSQAVLGGFSIKGLSGTQIHSQYVYNVLMPTLLDTGLVPSTAQMMETEEVLKGFVTGKSEWHSTAMEVDQRGKALVTFAVITEDAQEAVGLIQNFLDRGYGAYNGLADTQAITACLILGEPGEAFLRDLAAQRQAEGLTVSNGWKGAKELIPDLELSDELIGNYQAEALDLEYVKEFKAARARVQEKFNQAAAQQEVTDQLSVNATATTPRAEVAGERANTTELPELGNTADLSLGASEMPAGLETAAAGGSQKPPVPPTTITAEMPEEMPEEDPRLHESEQIHAISNDLLDSAQGVADAAETEGITDDRIVDFAEDGFLLTLDLNGQETVLPVNLTVSNRFLNRSFRSFFANHSKTPYNRVVVKHEPTLKKGEYVLEMRNQVRKPDAMDHFYMQLQRDHVGLLVDMLQRKGMENFLLKLEENPHKRYQFVTFDVFREGTLEKLPLTVRVPLKSFVPGSQLVLMNSGELGWILPGQTKAVPEEKLRVRLPKHQITRLVEVLQAQPADSPKLNISLRSTQNGAKFISTWISASNLSLGKTFGAPASSALEISPAAARNMMMGINYVLPGLASLLTPVLKKYGERKVMTLSVFLSFLSGAMATAGGFYGMVEGTTLGPIQKALFVAALFSMSVSGILKQLTTNLLIRANGGEVEYKKTEEKAQEIVRQETPKELIKRRLVEVYKETFWPVFAKGKYATYLQESGKKNQEQLAHLIRYNLGFIFKNVGTLAFLAAPYMLNAVGKWVGLDMHLDFSASFPLYALYSAVMTWRMKQAKLRDAYSAKNVVQSQNLLKQGVAELSEELSRPVLNPEDIDVKTRNLYDALDSYVLAQQRVNPKLKHKELFDNALAEALSSLQQSLQAKLSSASYVEQLTRSTETAIGKLDNRFKNMLSMLKVNGVLPLTVGMTMATVHEFVVSSSFADTMNSVIAKGDVANLLVAMTLYLPMIAGRIGGNWLSKKLSKGSMYLFCSALSAIGTGIIGFSGGNVPAMITGAAIASAGMGNYYTQMYNYIMEKHRKYNRELSALLSLTMAFGGIGAMFAPSSLGLTGNVAWDMAFAGTLLGLSWLCTRPMFASSSLLKAFKETPLGRHLLRMKQKNQASPLGQAVQQMKRKIKDKITKGDFPPQNRNLDDAAGAQ